MSVFPKVGKIRTPGWRIIHKMRVVLHDVEPALDKCDSGFLPPKKNYTALSLRGVGNQRLAVHFEKIEKVRLGPPALTVGKFRAQNS
jgi:hypothetical protein